MRAFIVVLLILILIVIAGSRMDFSGHQTGKIDGKSTSDVLCKNPKKPFALSLETGNPKKPANLVCVDEAVYNKYGVGDFYEG
jgi:hypothetical protein